MERRELIERITNIVKGHGLPETLDGWQTLKAELAQQTNNTSMFQLLCRFKNISDVNGFYHHTREAIDLANDINLFLAQQKHR